MSSQRRARAKKSAVKETVGRVADAINNGVKKVKDTIMKSVGSALHNVEESGNGGRRDSTSRGFSSPANIPSLPRPGMVIP